MEGENVTPAPPRLCNPAKLDFSQLVQGVLVGFGHGPPILEGAGLPPPAQREALVCIKSLLVSWILQEPFFWVLTAYGCTAWVCNDCPTVGSVSFSFTRIRIFWGFITAVTEQAVLCPDLCLSWMLWHRRSVLPFHCILPLPHHCDTQHHNRNRRLHSASPCPVVCGLFRLPIVERASASSPSLHNPGRCPWASQHV